ncbi:hypothetical protein GCM10009836_37410 [Pseudonocardia ailaonensis]|uniref:Transcriptional regulator WhiB n=1 Tax=Pseudonocardia ailaonensis TaxID=367279 RepID=A0ABN2N5R9_9PSEU
MGAVVSTVVSSMWNRWNWRVAARCRTTDADALFVRGAEQRQVRDFCGSCPVRTECLAYALDERVEHGVWGGMTERERRAVLRSRPDVASWAELLGEARTEHYSRSAAERTADALLDVAELHARTDTGIDVVGMAPEARRDAC